MATTEERMKILKMIQEGKISAEEGAKLLSALRESRQTSSRTRQPVGDAARGWLRVRVTDVASGKTKVNVNLPIGLVDAAMNIATQFVPEVGIDELKVAIQESSMSGKILDVIDEEDGEHVEIFIE